MLIWAICRKPCSGSEIFPGNLNLDCRQEVKYNFTMPLRPRRVCSWPGCTSLTRARYCARHEAAASAIGSDRRGMWPRRRPHGDYTGEWRAIREVILRVEPMCRMCGMPATCVDHVVPRHRGGTDHPANLQPLCARCHSRKTASEDGGYGNRERRQPDVTIP